MIDRGRERETERGGERERTLPNISIRGQKGSVHLRLKERGRDRMTERWRDGVNRLVENGQGVNSSLTIQGPWGRIGALSGLQDITCINMHEKYLYNTLYKCPALCPNCNLKTHHVKP